MGRRKSKRKPPPKRKNIEPLDVQFNCPFCNHEKSCEVKIWILICLVSYSALSGPTDKIYIILYFIGIVTLVVIICHHRIFNSFSKFKDDWRVFTKFTNFGFCHESQVVPQRDKSRNTARISCRVCSEDYQTVINFLSEPVDVYNDWIDACENAN